MKSEKKPVPPLPKPIRVEVVNGQIQIVKERLIIIEPVFYS